MHQLYAKWLNNIRSIFVYGDQARFLFIDGIRALSILAVIYLHQFFTLMFFVSPEAFKEIHRQEAIAFNGSYGVDSFFVISGFLIGDILFSDLKKNGKINKTKFFMRRAFRILPMLYATLLLISLWNRHNSENLIYNLLFINNFIPMDQYYAHALFTWSLAVEAQFYLIAPWLVTALFYVQRRLLFLVAIACIQPLMITAIVLYNHLSLPFTASMPWYLYTPFYVRHAACIFGLLASYLYQHAYEQTKAVVANSTTACLFGVISLAAMIIPVLIPYENDTFTPSFLFSTLFLAFSRFCFSCGVAGVIVLCLFPNVLQRAFKSMLELYCLRPIATISYSCFLLHPIIMVINYLVLYSGFGVKDIYHSDYFPLFGALNVFTSFLVSACTYACIEKPGIDFGHRYTSK